MARVTVKNRDIKEINVYAPLDGSEVELNPDNGKLTNARAALNVTNDVIAFDDVEGSFMYVDTTTLGDSTTQSTPGIKENPSLNFQANIRTEADSFWNFIEDNRKRKIMAFEIIYKDDSRGFKCKKFLAFVKGINVVHEQMIFNVEIQPTGDRYQE